MMRRMLLALTFLAALGAAGVGMANKAEAHDGWGRHRGCGYSSGLATYNGYRGVYYGGYPTYYPSPFVAGYTYAPPVVVYPGGRRHHRHRRYDRGGITFAIGF
jgi:hypothetical protein